MDVLVWIVGLIAACGIALAIYEWRKGIKWVDERGPGASPTEADRDIERARHDHFENHF